MGLSNGVLNFVIIQPSLTLGFINKIGMELSDPQQLRIILQLLLAVFLGAFMGIEREYVGKAAGIRTFALVSLGSCLFTILSREAFSFFLDQPGVSYDPSRLSGNVVMGIGFLGAGLIIFRGTKVEGLTTAAGLWVAAAVGMAVGCRWYLIGFFTALLVVLVLAGLRRFKLERFFGEEEKWE